jgi:hypothetical protein
MSVRGFGAGSVPAGIAPAGVPLMSNKPLAKWISNLEAGDHSDALACFRSGCRRRGGGWTDDDLIEAWHGPMVHISTDGQAKGPRPRLHFHVHTDKEGHVLGRLTDLAFRIADEKVEGSQEKEER